MKIINGGVCAAKGFTAGGIHCGIRKNADNGSQAIDLLMIAKYFERIGDHAQNIAEWVEYAITGKHKGEYLA